MHLVEVFLPVFDNDGVELEKDLYATVRRELADRFGGVTAFSRAPAQGFWKQDDGDVVRDDIVIFEVMTEHVDRAWWREYRETLRSRFRQEELLVRAVPVEKL